MREELRQIFQTSAKDRSDHEVEDSPIHRFLQKGAPPTRAPHPGSPAGLCPRLGGCHRAPGDYRFGKCPHHVLVSSPRPSCI